MPDKIVFVYIHGKCSLVERADRVPRTEQVPKLHRIGHSPAFVIDTDRLRPSLKSP